MKERSTKSNNFRIVLGIAITVTLLVLGSLNHLYRRGINVKEYNNFYNENNIVLFYEEENSTEIKKLDDKYGITDYVENEETQFDKVLKSLNILSTIAEKDGLKDSELNSGYAILEKKNGAKKVSFKDMAIIARDIMSATGVKTRIGAFRSKDAQYDTDYEYYVVEYWSTEYSKWVMIDFLDQGYFSDDNDIKLSALEVINCNLRKTPYTGKTTQKKYKNKLNKYLESYYVDIENSSTKIRSNCDIAYVKDESDINLKFYNRIPKPTIYTNQINLFEKSPFDRGVSSDENAYILLYLSEFIRDKSMFSSKDETLVIAAFNQDRTVKNFYLNINDSGYEKIENQKEITLTKGTNKIELSLDGEKTESSLIIEKN